MGLDNENSEEQVAVSFEDNLKKFVKFDDQNLFNNLPLVLFIAVLGVFHVANNHTAENKIRRMNTLEQDVKELRWIYMTSKSELMFKSKQSEVAKMIEAAGLKELSKPPYKIVVGKDEYK
jgi:hypothetical protein